MRKEVEWQSLSFSEKERLRDEWNDLLLNQKKELDARKRRLAADQQNQNGRKRKLEMDEKNLDERKQRLEVEEQWLDARRKKLQEDESMKTETSRR